MTTRKFPKLITAFEEYSVVNEIGNGPNGRVFECIDSGKNRFAAKLLENTVLGSTVRKRFKNEYDFCARTIHKNILKAIDYGLVEINGIRMPFFIMELFDGSLRITMRRGISTDDTLKIFVQILDGVEAAHKLGVVHRDLKPENVLFRASDSHSDDQYVVADFGIAHFSADQLATSVETRPGDRLANFTYAAPEQRTPRALVDHRADIFALGLMLNEMYTGAVPQGEGYRKVGDVAPMHAYLDELVASMIQQSADARPQSIEAIKIELQRRGHEVVQRQKLDESRGRVVPAHQITDELIHSPPHVVHAEWKGSYIYISLSRAVSKDWIRSFSQLRVPAAVQGAEPSRFRFEAEVAKVAASHDDAQRIIDQFKSWVERANAAYRASVEKAARDAENRERARRDEENRQRELMERVNRGLRW
jgi:serine/threonine protein kinase